MGTEMTNVDLNTRPLCPNRVTVQVYYMNYLQRTSNDDNILFWVCSGKI